MKRDVQVLCLWFSSRLGNVEPDGYGRFPRDKTSYFSRGCLPTIGWGRLAILKGKPIEGCGVNGRQEMRLCNFDTSPHHVHDFPITKWDLGLSRRTLGKVGKEVG